MVTPRQPGRELTNHHPHPTHTLMDLSRSVALILGGGRGTRLFPLTKIRAKPAVPLAAKYRLIDIPISNCINSGLNRAYVLTQFMSESLHRHLRQTYTFDHFNGGFVELLAAQQTVEQEIWYQGTADAVRKNLVHLREDWIEHVLILSGDQLYRMDFREMLQTHIDSGADATIAGIPVDRNEASALGIMQVDDSGRVRGFVEKPKSEQELAKVRMDPAWIDAHGVESKGRDCLASMGLYIFNKKVMFDLLENSDSQDFGKEVFPSALATHKVQLHLFDGYWEDIGTIRAFYEANLSLAGSDPPFEIGDANAPIYTRPRFLPPTIMGSNCTINGSLIADGCRIGRNVTIENSVIGLRSSIGDNVTIRDTVMMGADDVDSTNELNAEIPIGIGSGSTVVGAILDKNCRIGEKVQIANPEKIVDRGEDEPIQFRDGIPIVIKDAIVPAGTSV